MKINEDFEMQDKCSDQEIEEALIWFWKYVKCQTREDCHASCRECSFDYDALLSTDKKIKYYKIAHDCILYYIKSSHDFHEFIKKINVSLKDFPDLTEELERSKR